MPRYKPVVSCQTTAREKENAERQGARLFLDVWVIVATLLGAAADGTVSFATGGAAICGSLFGNLT